MHAPVWVETELPTRRHRGRAWLLLALGILCALLFLADLIAVESGRLATEDRSLALQTHRLFGHGTFHVFQAISFVGGPEVRSVAAGLVALALALVGRWWSTLLLAVTAAGVGLLERVVKALVDRPRPHLFPGALHAGDPSFPSGHALGTFVFLGILVYLVWRLTRRRGLVLIACVLALVLTLLVGLSRVVLGVHYPTDVVGGYALGGAWLALMLLCFAPLVGRER
jgi:undecaprenyl-diphosphatase